MPRASKYTSISKQPEYYSDFKSDFSLNLSTGYLNMLTNSDAIIQSVKNLILTDKFERFYQPDLGSKVHSLLFDLNDVETHNILKDTIKETLQQEPRVIDPIITIKPLPDEGEVYIQVIFNMINIQEPFSFELLLKRTR